jgi:uncharacterized protein (DUF58 family)
MKAPASANNVSYRVIMALPFYFSVRFFILFGIASGLLIIVYQFYPYSLYVPLLVDGALIIAAIADFALGPSPAKITIERPIPFPLAVDRPNSIQLEITNRTGGPVSVLVRDDIPDNCASEPTTLETTVRPGVLSRLAYRLVPKQRGNANFGNIHLWVRGELGLVWKHGESQAVKEVKFYPGLGFIEKGRMAPRRLLAEDMIRSMRQRGQGTEFDSLREYVPGDDARQIHWSTTARKGRLMVRQTRLERSRTLFLVLDAGRMMTARVLGKTKFDHGLNAALMLSRSALELGDHVGLAAIAAETLCFLPPSKGTGQFGRILDATYSLEPRIQEPRFHLILSEVIARLKRRSLVVVFTDLTDERASRGLIRYNLALLPKHVSLVVAMSDNELLQIADTAPGSEVDLYRQAVAAEMLSRREQLLAKLRSSGVMVLDTPPDRISGALLDRYLEIKTRNLL